jgi:SAM-dependent methyltransferase
MIGAWPRGNRERIEDGARSAGIQLFAGDVNRAGEFLEIGAGPFDMVVLHDIVGHFHDSPVPHFNRLIDLLKIGGFLFVTGPSAANLRNRLVLAAGKTNFSRLEAFLVAKK